MKTTLLTTVLITMLVTTPAVLADPKFRARHDAGFTEYAKVIDVQPIIRHLQVTTPQRECWEEQVSYPVEQYYHSNSAGGMILGGLIGGAIGSRFGGGNGQKAATLAGTLLGASIGHDRAGRHVEHSDSYRSRRQHHCRTDYQRHSEQRIDGYLVTYRYRGQLFTERMAYDPGDRIRLQIDVRPERY